MTNKELSELAQKHGASDIQEELESNAYRPMVKTVTAEAQANGISGTPTIFVDSKPLQQEDFSSFLKKVQEAKKK